MNCMATLKHISSKNSDYTAIEAYLVYQHDAFTGKQLLDEQGRPKLRESYLLDTLECGDFSFATACLLANRKYGKNTRGIDIADNLSPGIKQKVFSGEVKFTNEEMSKLVQASVEHRSDVLAQILHPEALEVLESASAEFEPEKAEPVPMPTPQTEEFRCYHVPDEFMKVYKSLSRATEMMKNSWKKTLKNNPSYFTDPEKQKVLRFAMQRPANYLTEIETYLEKALAEALEEEKTA